MKKDTHIYTVSELTKNIKILLESNFPFIAVEGEISNLKIPVSGHAYFTLKDDKASLAAVLFKSNHSLVKFELKDGLKIIAFGRISIYEPKGSYQLYVEKIEPAGLGALNLAFEQLKKKLEKEGLFAKEKKKSIPFLPTTIGVVTSKTGAAIRDILNVLNRRFASVGVILRPVKVQGEGAALEVAQAIEEFNHFNKACLPKDKVDVVIVGRGGGSLEDLWAFNEEIVARAIFRSEIPIISAVGHEIDFTISDFVADLRAPTPSAAAELVIANKENLKDELAHLSSRLNTVSLNNLEIRLKYLNSLKEACLFRNPINRVRYHMEKLDGLAISLDRHLRHFLQIKEQHLKAVNARLDSLSPLSVLSRGYSISFLLPKKEVILDASKLSEGDEILTKVKKGSFISRVKGVGNG